MNRFSRSRSFDIRSMSPDERFVFVVQDVHKQSKAWAMEMLSSLDHALTRFISTENNQTGRQLDKEYLISSLTDIYEHSVPLTRAETHSRKVYSRGRRIKFNRPKSITKQRPTGIDACFRSLLMNHLMHDTSGVEIERCNLIRFMSPWSAALEVAEWCEMIGDTIGKLSVNRNSPTQTPNTVPKTYRVAKAILLSFKGWNQKQRTGDPRGVYLDIEYVSSNQGAGYAYFPTSDDPRDLIQAQPHRQDIPITRVHKDIFEIYRPVFQAAVDRAKIVQILVAPAEAGRLAQVCEDVFGIKINPNNLQKLLSA